MDFLSSTEVRKFRVTSPKKWWVLCKTHILPRRKTRMDFFGTLSPRIMVQWKMGPFNICFLSFRDNFPPRLWEKGFLELELNSSSACYSKMCLETWR